jgi:hypothetical protein
MSRRKVLAAFAILMSVLWLAGKYFPPARPLARPLAWGLSTAVLLSLTTALKRNDVFAGALQGGRPTTRTLVSALQACFILLAIIEVGAMFKLQSWPQGWPFILLVAVLGTVLLLRLAGHPGWRWFLDE